LTVVHHNKITWALSEAHRGEKSPDDVGAFLRVKPVMEHRRG
jgi:hypothetical protein